MKILIVCSSNICRSPFAEMYLRRLVANNDVLKQKVEWVQSSAVLNKSKAIHPKAVAALREYGFDDKEILSHKPQFLYFNSRPFKEADIIIGMSRIHKFLLPIWYKKKYRNLSELAVNKYVAIADPFLSKSQEDYNACMKQIAFYVERVAEKIEKDEICVR